MLISDNMRNTAILVAQDDAQKAAIHRQRAAAGVRGWPARHPLERKRRPPEFVKHKLPKPCSEGSAIARRDLCELGKAVMSDG
jgi:hypothetical protein